jgi:Arc/MetJ-type ribon-helix-helix transcriptional regulator
MNVTLRGRVSQVLDFLVEKGYANTKSEAIRLAILNYGEEVMVKRKLDRIDREIKEGKRKALNAREALGEYAKYLE